METINTGPSEKTRRPAFVQSSVTSLAAIGQRFLARTDLSSAPQTSSDTEVEEWRAKAKLGA